MLSSARIKVLIGVQLAVATFTGMCRAEAESLGPHVQISRGAVNGVCLEHNGHRLVVYGDPQECWKTADMVLFTHSRRDVVWAGRALVEGGAQSVVPAAEAEQFTKVGGFWTEFWEKRFHDYIQQSTRILTTPLRVDRTTRGGDRLDWQDLTLHVLDTPGYTRGAVSYFVEGEGRKYGFVGDLIYGDGRLLDLYSLQDAVPQTRIGGYHGYAGRIGELLASLRKVAAENADVLVPARGPVIREPAAALANLIARLQAAYENYLSISAGRWYFRDSYDVLATRALGGSGRVSWMPYAKTVEKTPPDWIVPLDNSRLILSADRSGLLVDCGSRAIIERVRRLRDEGRLRTLDGLFITHYHDDHTDKVNELVQEFACPIYVTPILEDILRQPGAYRMPCLTPNAIHQLQVVPDGHRMRWKEFALAFYDFPGQTLYHDALLVDRDTGGRIFFVGDSFTPSGLDDYCLQNRNFLHPHTGFLYCLDLLQHKIPADALLVNEHVLEPFRFDPDQVTDMRRRLEKRRELLRDLFPWDAPDYGLDEQWAGMGPYAQEVKPGAWADLTVRFLNHSATPNTFTVVANVPDGFVVEPPKVSIAAAPGREVEARFRIKAPRDTARPLSVLTADIQVGSWDLHEWCESLLRVTP
jgi:glyoxylase-like metal-dependent hydrolase (beta-lactamase superfamily II)